MNISENLNLRQWAQDLADWKASGLTRKQWCELHNLSLSAYDYRCKRVRKALQEANRQTESGVISMVEAKQEASEGGPIFAKVNFREADAAVSGICMKLSDVELVIAPDTPIEHLRMILEAFGYAK